MEKHLDASPFSLRNADKKFLAAQEKFSLY
jgi:hypothetical protein